MAFEQTDNIVALINSVAARVGTLLKSAAGVTVSSSTPVYVDSNSLLATGGYPFAVQMFAGVQNTANSVMSVEGFTTGSANATLTQTLVQGATGSLTITGFMRVTITDDAGNLTNGAYYVPFGTLA